MGVLINKYFKMPKSCDSCHFGQEYECVDEAGYGCLLTMKTRPKGKTDRPDYCPLIELPPHGRLIDADALVEELIKRSRTNPMPLLGQMVDFAPTIIEASPYRYEMLSKTDKPHGIYIIESEEEND